MTLPAIFFIIILVLVVALIWLHYARVQAGRVPERRSFPALEVLQAALARSAETGRPVHLSPGASTIGAGEGQRASTAELLAGLNIIGRAAEQAAAGGASIVVSSADAVAHLALRGMVRQSYRSFGQEQSFNARQIELWAHGDAMAYTAAVAAIYDRTPLEASLLTGAFGQEALLATETGVERMLPQVLGSTHPSALGLMAITTPHILIGEEIYAAEAYLTSTSIPQARLLTHDALRTVVIWLMLIAFGYGFIRIAFGWPVLAGW